MKRRVWMRKKAEKNYCRVFRRNNRSDDDEGPSDSGGRKITR